MRYLIVAAHPDDEALGAGALIRKAVRNGDEVYVCLLSHLSPTRYDDLVEGIKESHKILGVKKAFVTGFECLRFKDADHFQMVTFIESCIKECKPDVVIAHHPSDVHIDHAVAAECTLEACKLPQRQTSNVPPISRVMFMEVPSSTDWNIDGTRRSFMPNLFVEVSADDIEKKIKAIDVYKDVIRKLPHPRAEEAIAALATIRGTNAGYRYAEAYQLVFALEV